jgi:hypothetical protein
MAALLTCSLSITGKQERVVQRHRLAQEKDCWDRVKCSSLGILFFFRKWNKFRPIWKYAVPDVIEYYYILLHTLFLCTGKMFATYPFYIATPSNEMDPVQLLYLLFHY